jgi:DNA-binding transcriptional LysR family regulator
MQHLNWNDLRYILALDRTRSLSGAARSLGVDNTTVSRRLAALQAAIGAQLCQQLGKGDLQLTRAGEQAVAHAEKVEREVNRLARSLHGADTAISGTVRLTAVPIIVDHVLVPALASFVKRHPKVQLELIAEPHELSLTRRETDLALRLARPKVGGTRVIARRVGLLRYAIYRPSSCSRREASALPWITYDETMSHLPQARWLASVSAKRNESMASVRVNDAEALIEAIAAGLGKTLLPSVVADHDARLQRLRGVAGMTEPVREIWLLTHADLRHLSRVEAVVQWIERVVPR